MYPLRDRVLGRRDHIWRWYEADVIIGTLWNLVVTRTEQPVLDGVMDMHGLIMGEVGVDG